MKTTAKSIIPTNSHSSIPFFNNRGEGGFVSQPEGKEQSFFGPSFLQPKLTIGQPNDKYEQEADAMAEQVMSSEGPDVQTKCAACRAEEGLQPKLVIQKQEELEEESLPGEPSIMRSSLNSAVGSSRLASKLSQNKGGGNPLPEATISWMSNAFSSDFNHVRIHTGGDAVQMNKELGARAFTHGSDIYFNRGEYSPESSNGKKLLAHELTHVIQQTEQNASAPFVQRAITLKNPGSTTPHPPGATGPFPTRAFTLNDWLDTLCPDGNWDVDATTGVVDSANRGTFCAARPRRGSTHHSTSSHPTSCECLCELTAPGARDVEVQIDNNLTVGGTSFPLSASGEGATAHLSPTDKASGFSGKEFVGITGAGATSPHAGTGRTQTIPDPPWIIFGHEVCGHARLQATNMSATQFEHSATPQGDRTTIDVENRIRREHSTVAASLGIRRGRFRARNAAGALASHFGSVYRVSSGETLSGIAVRCGIPVANMRDHIWRFNGDRITVADQDRIRAGEDLLIEGIDWHEVIQGENLSTIAQMWDVSLPSLKRANPNITGPSFIIRPGDMLLIPAS